MNQGHGNIEGFTSTGDIKKDAQTLYELGVSREEATVELHGIYYPCGSSREKWFPVLTGAIVSVYGPDKGGK